MPTYEPKKNFNNKISYIHGLRYQAEVDYCIGRLFHFGFSFFYESKYYFQQSLEKYMKAVILRKLINTMQNVEEFEVFLKKRELGHNLGNLWKKCNELYPDEMFDDFLMTIFLEREFDSQNVLERSRYPQTEFGEHPIGLLPGYVKNVDEIIFGFYHIGSKIKGNPLKSTIKYADRWNKIIASYEILEKSINHKLLRECFYYRNDYFKPFLRAYFSELVQRWDIYMFERKLRTHKGPPIGYILPPKPAYKNPLDFTE